MPLPRTSKPHYRNTRHQSRAPVGAFPSASFLIVPENCWFRKNDYCALTHKVFRITYSPFSSPSVPAQVNRPLPEMYFRRWGCQPSYVVRGGNVENKSDADLTATVGVACQP